MQRVLGVHFEAPELLANACGFGNGGIWDLLVRGVRKFIQQHCLSFARGHWWEFGRARQADAHSSLSVKQHF